MVSSNTKNCWQYIPKVDFSLKLKSHIHHHANLSFFIEFNHFTSTIYETIFAAGLLQMYSISNNPATNDDYIKNVEVKMNSIKTERFDGVYVKL